MVKPQARAWQSGISGQAKQNAFPRSEGDRHWANRFLATLPRPLRCRHPRLHRTWEAPSSSRRKWARRGCRTSAISKHYRAAALPLCSVHFLGKRLVSFASVVRSFRSIGLVILMLYIVLWRFHLHCDCWYLKSKLSCEFAKLAPSCARSTAHPMPQAAVLISRHGSIFR